METINLRNWSKLLALLDRFAGRCQAVLPEEFECTVYIDPRHEIDNRLFYVIKLPGVGREFFRFKSEQLADWKHVKLRDYAPKITSFLTSVYEEVYRDLSDKDLADFTQLLDQHLAILEETDWTKIETTPNEENLIGTEIMCNQDNKALTFAKSSIFDPKYYILVNGVIYTKEYTIVDNKVARRKVLDLNAWTKTFKDYKTVPSHISLTLNWDKQLSIDVSDNRIEAFNSITKRKLKQVGELLPLTFREQEEWKIIDGSVVQLQRFLSDFNQMTTLLGFDLIYGLERYKQWPEDVRERLMLELTLEMVRKNNYGK